MARILLIAIAFYAGQTIPLSASQEHTPFDLSQLGPFYQPADATNKTREFGDISAAGQDFLYCAIRKQQQENCTDTMNASRGRKKRETGNRQRRRIHGRLSSNENTETNEGGETQGASRAKHHKNSHHHVKKNAGKTSTATTTECGKVYTLTAGDTRNIALPNANATLCEIGFQPDSKSQLGFDCSVFNVGSCNTEFLFLATTNAEQLFCGSDKPTPLTGETAIFLMYDSQTKGTQGSKIDCTVTATAKTGKSGGSSASSSGNSASSSSHHKGKGASSSSHHKGKGASSSSNSGGTSSSSGGKKKTSRQATNCNSVCGSSNKGTGVTRIVGGNTATKGAYPWLVLVIIKTAQSTMQCDGSLITTTHVVTASHCVDFTGIKEVQITAGAYDLSSSTGTQISIAQNLTKHPQYDPNTQINDVAIITLKTAIKWSSNVSPICLPSGVQHVGSLAVVAGWGTLSYGGQLPNTLQQVAVKVLANSMCVKEYKKASITIKNTELCAAAPNKDACQGDSGGPLMIQENGKWAEIGIVSFGIGCADPNYAGVYTRVSSYTTWILQEVASGSC